MKPSGILNFENVPADAGDPDVKVFVNGEEVSAGGGDSDFTTATVTIATGLGIRNFLLPEIVDNEEYVAILCAYPAPASILDDGEYLVPLYKGKLVIENAGIQELTITGDATFEDYMLTITGDCEITAYTPAE